jgi:hypothetical protein
MKNIKQIFFFLLISLVIISCFRYDLDEPVPNTISTFKTVIGGNGNDNGRDIIELNGSCLMVGPTGQGCDVKDAFAALLDSETGKVMVSSSYGDPHVGKVEKFRSVIKYTSGRVYATGYVADLESDCDKPRTVDANVYLVEIDPIDLSVKNDTIFKGSNEIWDQGSAIIYHQNKIYVGGQNHYKLSTYTYDDSFNLIHDTVTTLDENERYGKVVSLMINEADELAMTGESVEEDIEGDGKDKSLFTYFGLIDLSSNEYIF